MPLVDTLALRPGTARWSVWSTVASLAVTDPGQLDAARALVEAELAAIDAACSRFRPDAELAGLAPTAQVSPLLADLVATALTAARRTGGAVDPTVAPALRRLGYDRDITELTALPGHPGAYLARPAPGWSRIHLDGHTLTRPPGVELDLGATAKARAADRCAALVHGELGIGVLVSLGGDLATAGPGPTGARGWSVLVRDREGEPECTVAVPPGAALATSSTINRTWTAYGRRMHHIVDPATGLPAPAHWRTVSVAAPTCVEANTLATATIVRGAAGLRRLRDEGVAARLVDARGDVVTVGAWPRSPAVTPC